MFKAGKVSNHFVKNVYEYRIAGVKACPNIFPYFDKYTLLTKKISILHFMKTNLFRFI
jgi:hypothetical protein